MYIGADRFGARAAAGNPLEDIKALCDYAHQYGARIYVTVNTIIYEEELDATQELITNLAKIGVDALLVQDMGTLEMRRIALNEVGHAPMLHASTQCDTRSAEKVQWLRNLGFSRAVLAREMSLAEIAEIHRAVPDIELEVFVHGALCVSYSGICYASQHCFGRSANRGECAQFCRMKFDLIDAGGQMIEHERHLLSLKDMSQLHHMEELADAGATSFKIEGRLKDIGYVKNVVSAYSQRLDEIVRRRPDDYCRTSFGKVEYHFEPSLKKTFNRGFTSYFLKGRQPDIASFDTPKALGEYVGKVKEVRRDSFNVSGTASFANGDGLCFINDKCELEGFRVNRAEGNRLFPFKMPVNIRPGVELYRNNDEAFEKILAGDTAERRLPVSMYLGQTADGFRLTIRFQVNRLSPVIESSTAIAFEHQEAKKPQADNIRKQLAKLGTTNYMCDEIELEDGIDSCFIPSSLLSDLRRQAIEAFTRKLVSEVAAQSEETTIAMEETGKAEVKVWHPAYKRFSYLYNISNHKARAFYEAHGMVQVGQAFEVLDGKQSSSLRWTPDAMKVQREQTQCKQEHIVMQCRHCIRYTLGYCVRHGGQKPTWREPLALRLGDGRRFRLEFNCDECQMDIYSED